MYITIKSIMFVVDDCPPLLTLTRVNALLAFRSLALTSLHGPLATNYAIAVTESKTGIWMKNLYLFLSKTIDSLSL